MNEEEYYIVINDPVSFRKDILLASKNTLHSLANYNRILKVRELKRQKVDSLKRDVKELMLLTTKLKEVMPQFSDLPPAAMAEVQQAARKGKEAGGFRAKKPAKKTVAEVNDIEKALKDIQKKLDKL